MKLGSREHRMSRHCNRNTQGKLFCIVGIAGLTCWQDHWIVAWLLRSYLRRWTLQSLIKNVGFGVSAMNNGHEGVSFGSKWIYLEAFDLRICSWHWNSTLPRSFSSTAMMAPFPRTASIISSAEGFLHMAHNELLAPLLSSKAIRMHPAHSM